MPAGSQRQHMPFTVTTLPVKMRLERSAERDKREYNNISADIAKANASAILNRPAVERTPNAKPSTL